MPTAKVFLKGSDFPTLEAGKLRLYSNRFCPYAQRTRILLNHKKIPYETVNVGLKQTEKPDWFLDRNPLGLVPVLEHDDKVVYESSLCNEYLDAVYPENKLTPDDPYLNARDKMLVETNGKAVTLYYKFILQGRQKDDWILLLDKLDPIEKEATQRGNFFGGVAPSMVDFMVWPWFERMLAFKSYNADFELPVDRFPSLISWIQRMYNVPAVQETIFDARAHLTFYDSYRSETPAYDYGLD